ncbi:MAG: hypothetical protein HZC41_13585 [Chloroflexi bacterium]|nr:hypothetical protein [Chloroflexota bacterium]
MRRNDGFIALVVSLFLLLAGLRPDALPYLSRGARYSDAAISHWPSALFLRQSVLERDQFPLWRETIMAGQPFAANPLNKTAYPPQWLVLLLPPALHLNVMIGLHLLIAGMGMNRWALALGLRAESALFAALAYVLSPPLIAHTGAGHLDILYALAWWPWLMWSVRRLLAEIGVAPVLQMALSAALVFLSDVRVSLFAFITAGGYTVWKLRRIRPALPRLVLVGALFLLLTASVTVPLLAWSPYLSRAGLTPDDAGVLALQPGNLLGLLLFAVPPGVETLTYLGLPVLVLAVAGLWTRGRAARILGIVVFVVVALYALGPNGPLWPLLVRLFPALLWFRVPSRAWLVLALLAPPLAGFGLERLVLLARRLRTGETVAGLKRLRLAVAGFAVALVAAGVFILALPDLPPVIGVGVGLAGGALGLILLLALTGRLAPERVAPVLIALTLLELAGVGLQWLTWRGPEVWLEPQRALAERLVAEGASRVYSPSYSLEQQVAEVYGLRLFGGVDPFQLTGVVQAVEQGSGVPVRGYSVILPPVDDVTGDDLSQANRDAVINSRVLAEWDVSHVVAAYTIVHPRLEYVGTLDDVNIYRNRDYGPETASRAVPGWPTNWPNLPDAATVKNLNDLTAAAALVSGVTFWVCVFALVFILKSGSRQSAARC